jgi:hypothetical protein
LDVTILELADVPPYAIKKIAMTGAIKSQSHKSIPACANISITSLPDRVCYHRKALAQRHPDWSAFAGSRESDRRNQ